MIPTLCAGADSAGSRAYAIALASTIANSDEFDADNSALATDGALGMTVIRPPAIAPLDAELGSNEGEEKVYDGLLPGDGYTVVMDSVPDQNGSTECVQLIKTLLGAPRTIFWKQGRSVQSQAKSITPGTAIATFVNGQYPQTGRTGMHAAIFVRATEAGIFVLDQFRGRTAVTERFIPWFNHSNGKRSNNASTYSTIRW